MGDELKKQEKKLDDIDANMDRQQAKLDKTVKRAQEVVKSAQAEDHFCIDIILIVVILAVGLIIYNLLK